MPSWQFAHGRNETSHSLQIPIFKCFLDVLAGGSRKGTEMSCRRSRFPAGAKNGGDQPPRMSQRYLGPVNTTRADGVASENWFKRGGISPRRAVAISQPRISTKHEPIFTATRVPGTRTWRAGVEAGVPGTRTWRAGVEAEGTGPIFPISLSLVASVTGYSALLAPGTRENWLPSPPPW